MLWGTVADVPFTAFELRRLKSGLAARDPARPANDPGSVTIPAQPSLSAGKTAAKGLKSAETTSNPDAARQDRPADTPFLTKKAKPSLGVGFDRAIGLADQAALHMQGLLSNSHSSFGRLLTGEDQVIHGIDALGPTCLEDDVHGVQKHSDGRGSEAVDMTLRLAGKSPADVLISV